VLKLPPPLKKIVKAYTRTVVPIRIKDIKKIKKLTKQVTKIRSVKDIQKLAKDPLINKIISKAKPLIKATLANTPAYQEYKNMKQKLGIRKLSDLKKLATPEGALSLIDAGMKMTPYGTQYEMAKKQLGIENLSELKDLKSKKGMKRLLKKAVKSNPYYKQYAGVIKEYGSVEAAQAKLGGMLNKAVGQSDGFKAVQKAKVFKALQKSGKLDKMVEQGIVKTVKKADGSTGLDLSIPSPETDYRKGLIL
jgi:hypothetical protein